MAVSLWLRSGGDPLPQSMVPDLVTGVVPGMAPMPGTAAASAADMEVIPSPDCAALCVLGFLLGGYITIRVDRTYRIDSFLKLRQLLEAETAS